MTRGKLDTSVAVRVDDTLREALDREQRRRETELGVALTRARMVRLLLEEHLGLRAAPEVT